MRVIEDKINEILSKKGRCIVAIDGRCGGGKTTLAKKLAEATGAFVIHMDDFFLQPQQRSAQRLSEPGENVDHERFLCEVLKPVSEGAKAKYRPFLCSSMDFGDEIEVDNPKLVIVEGSYSCHEKLWNYYDLHVFVSVDPKVQAERIEKRNGKDALEVFLNKWIPMEEQYFAKFNIEQNCEIVIK